MLYYVWVNGVLRAVWEVGRRSPLGLATLAAARRWAQRVYGHESATAEEARWGRPGVIELLNQSQQAARMRETAGASRLPPKCGK